MEPLLEVDAVTKRFGALVVLENLSLEVAAGQALGVVGPNGAGKTTALNVVAGDLSPSSGHVRFDGRDVTRLPAHRRCRLGIARTAQVPRPFEGLTVFENVLVGATFGAEHRHAGAAREAAAVDALALTGMVPAANRLAGTLTLLDRKRLELSRALATRPRLLLLDEIAGGLTEAEVVVLVAVIKEIQATGVAIVWIEHIVHALLSVVDRMLALDYGRTLLEGEPDEVMASPEVQAVYLGTEPVPLTGESF
jgi:branched-chain amino acid transport system ATP-binding protein